MAHPHLKALLPFLLLLFVGTVCNAMIAPFMGFFIVEGLKQPPWTISIYAGALSCLAIAINRQFAGRIDRGKNAFPLIGIALAGYLSANLSLSIVPSLWTVLTFGVIGFGVSTSAVSTMFSLGGGLAAKHQIENRRLNAFMRATTSTAWMVGGGLLSRRRSIRQGRGLPMLRLARTRLVGALVVCEATKCYGQAQGKRPGKP
ncbi:hypothetical protein [Rhizobium sp. NXC24]|uniref:hypothetical protein n=1 Tax=Rhizobium sp. NXC24 TaxID=2048897 RepID=UPI001FE0D713|nr:hypothetical protein [Rhizobium sp. NXC24]